METGNALYVGVDLLRVHFFLGENEKDFLCYGKEEKMRKEKMLTMSILAALTACGFSGGSPGCGL